MNFQPFPHLPLSSTPLPHLTFSFNPLSSFSHLFVCIFSVTLSYSSTGTCLHFRLCFLSFICPFVLLPSSLNLCSPYTIPSLFTSYLLIFSPFLFLSLLCLSSSLTLKYPTQDHRELECFSSVCLEPPPYFRNISFHLSIYLPMLF